MYCTTELFVIIVVVFLVQALFMVIIFRLFSINQPQHSNLCIIWLLYQWEEVNLSEYSFALFTLLTNLSILEKYWYKPQTNF